MSHRKHALVPVVDGVVVDEDGLDLHGAEEAQVVRRAVVHIERDDRVIFSYIAENETKMVSIGPQCLDATFQSTKSTPGKKKVCKI